MGDVLLLLSLFLGVGAAMVAWAFLAHWIINADDRKGLTFAERRELRRLKRQKRDRLLEKRNRETLREWREMKP